MKRRRRNVEIFGLSFLDCICCGFGAIVLLLVLSKTGEPSRLEETRGDLEAIVERLHAELLALGSESRDLAERLRSRREGLDRERRQIATMSGDLSRIRGEFDTSRQDAAVQQIVEGALADAQQELSAEMKRLLGTRHRRRPGDETVGGIPVDSEYIVFVIDTSGSMQRFSWGRVLQKLSETLSIHPRVKGIQVMNDMGEYMFSSYRGQWIPDSPGRRAAILRRLRSWTPFSNSSPVEGISAAIRTLRDPQKKMSLYVFGDEFSGLSIDDVVKSVGRINRAPRGGRHARIHAVGFPLPPGQIDLQQTGVRFATLMRVLCHENGGTFVGLSF